MPPIKVKGKAPKKLARLRKSQSEHIDFRIQAAENKPVQVYLYDVIGWPFIEAQDLLYQVPSGAKEIDVHLNTPGGDVFEGMAIYNYFRDHQAKINMKIDSLAASSGSLVAMSGDSISMAAASFLMIHNPWSMMIGDGDELRKEADLLDKISNIFADTYSSQSGKSRQEMLAAMKEETWYTPDEAIAAGLASEISEPGGDSGGDQGGAVLFNLAVFQNTPQALTSTVSRQARVNNNKSMEEDDMDKKVRAILERLGLSKDATDEQAWAYLADIDLEKIEAKEEKQQVKAELEKIPAPQGVQPQDGGRQDPQVDPAQAAREAVKAERQRVADIKAAVQKAGLDDRTAQHLIDKDFSLEQAQDTIKTFAAMQQNNPPVGAGRIQVSSDERDKFRSAVIDGLGFRTGARPTEPVAGYEEFRGASIESIARICLERAGVDTRGMNTRDRIAREILKRSGAAGGFSTDDFTSIFLDVANKSLLKAYREAPNTWRPWVNVVSASDFKTIYGISLSEAPDLELVNESGEYKSGSMSDNQESYSVATYGKIIYLTRQMIVNDDLRAFTRLPQLMGMAARRKEGDLVWAKITANPNMNDGNALFSSNHSNLEATAANKGTVSPDRLSTGRTKMRKQTGPNGSTLDIQPAFLAVPVEQETESEIILRSTALPETQQSSGVYNPWANRLQPIAEPRLSSNSTKAWYLIGDPGQVDTVEVAYLDGNEEPYTEEEVQFERDAVGYKIRHDFGCGIMEYRGFYKNPGE